MVTLYDKSIQNGKILAKGFCLSADTKPTNQIANGSTITEVDKGDVYIFNEEEEEWVKQYSLQSIGGGGGGGGGVFVVNVTGIYDETTGNTVYTPDKTFEETTAAAESGQVIIVNYDGAFSTILTFTSSGDFGDILRGNYTSFGASGPDSSYIESYDIEWTSEEFYAQYYSKTV